MLLVAMLDYPHMGSAAPCYWNSWEPLGVAKATLGRLMEMFCALELVFLISLVQVASASILERVSASEVKRFSIYHSPQTPG